MVGAAAARVVPEAVTAEAWEPFGWVPVADTDPTDGSHRLEYAWSDPHVNVIGHTLDEVPVVPYGLRCDRMYRHVTHTQVLMVLDHPCVIAVARAGGEPSGADQIHAFRLDPLQSVVLHRGTWHWGPFPTATESVRLFNVQGLRYAEDNEMVDLAARGMAVDVITR
jgi:ureidoglycolate hydrolase